MRETDIIIFSGQSNMQGQSEVLSEEKIVENAYEYRYLTKEAVPLKNPVGENITTEKKKGIKPEEAEDINKWLADTLAASSTEGHTNLLPEFCRNYIKNAQKRLWQYLLQREAPK